MKKFYLLTKTLLVAVMLLGWSSAKAQSWTAGAEVAAGEFYLYNIAADRYLNNGSSWSTHSIVDGQGFVLTISIQDGKYRLNSGVGGGKGPYVWGDWTNNDNGSNGWYFKKVDYAGYTNVYTIQQTNSEGTYLFWNGGGSGAWGNEVYGSGASVNANSYWLLIPKTTRQSYGTASPSNPLDVTYLIGDPDFEKRVSNSTNDTPVAGSGQTSAFWNNGGFWRQYSAQTSANAIFFEKYSGGGLTTADKIYQSPTLTPGKYRLTATAYATCTKAYLYAGDKSSQISANGKYTVDFTVASEAAVDLGVKIEAGGTGNWVYFDNVRLYYLGNDCSSSITNPNFDTDASGWNGAGSWGNNEIEYYGGKEAQKTFNLYQDLTGLSAGIYALEAQGFYRNGVGIDEKRAKAQEELLASLYAKGEDDVERSTTLLSIYEEAGKVSATSSLFGDIPNRMNEAQNFISAGYYSDNKVLVEVGAAGTLTIGAKKSTPVTNDWTILDNFTLTKLNYATLADAYAAEWTARKTSAQALLNNSDYSNIVSGSAQRTALSTAVAATPSDLAGYISSLAALRTAVNNFKAAKYAYDQYATNAAKATEANEEESTTYKNITGDEKTTFDTTYSTYVSGFSPSPNNAANYYDAEVAIKSATDVFTDESVLNNYNEYAAESATATLLGTDISGVSTPTTSSAALTAAHSINVLNYAKVVAEEYEDVSGSTLGDWTDTNVTERDGQHWDGSASSKYFEMNSGYGDESWNMSRTQSVSLSAGKYILKVACRVSTYANATLSVTVGGSTISTISGHQGDTGLGITTSGEGCYISHDVDDTKVYANSNAGRGFEWKYIPFELAETGTATLSFTAEGHAKYQYVSFTSLALLTDPKVAARTTLLNKINEASTEYNSGANVGSGVFQIPAAAGSTFSAAITTAQGVYDDDDAVLEDITGATSTLNTALTTYQGTTLNAPSSSTRYKLALSGRGTLSYDASGEADEGGYGLPFSDPKDYMAQTFFLTQQSGNNYKLSFVDFDGTTRYVCTGENAKEGLGNARIRTTTDASKALIIAVSATSTANVFNMLNTSDSNNKIGSNGGGMYTANDYTSWSIAEASQATVDVVINGNLKYATRIFPFAPTLPDGVIAYSCSKTSGDVLTLAEDDSPAANTPYILYAESDIEDNLEGWGTATETSYEGGLFTGVYENTAAPVNSYVLQYNDEKFAFYKVAEGEEPTVPAYRCYLTVASGSGSGARAAFFFPGGDITKIKAVEALTSGKVQIFNASGAQIPALQKGMNIIRMEDGTTQKVMVK